MRLRRRPRQSEWPSQERRRFHRRRFHRQRARTGLLLQLRRRHLRWPDNAMRGLATGDSVNFSHHQFCIGFKTNGKIYTFHLSTRWRRRLQRMGPSPHWRRAAASAVPAETALAAANAR